MVNPAVTSAIIERDAVIQARKETLRRMAKAPDPERRRLHSEYFQPLNERLLALNKRLGV